MCNPEAKLLLVPNPLLKSKLKKYIWINDSSEECRNAQHLFDYLMKKNIYVAGFATVANSMFQLKMYNKEIFDFDTLDMQNSMVFYDNYFEGSGLDCGYRGERARIIDPNMHKENVVIWGAGEMGEQAHRLLADAGIEVKCFIDRNRRLEGAVKCGLSIHAPDKLDEFGRGVTVVEALVKWKELDESICGQYENRFYYDGCSNDGNVFSQVTCLDGGIEKAIFNLGYFWLFNPMIGKRVYIYGTGAVEKEFVKYLKLMDIDFVGFAVDNADSQVCGLEYSYPIKNIEEVLKENNYFIWIYAVRKCDKLEQMGLKRYETYDHWNFEELLGTNLALDINLGYNRLLDSAYAGIMVYGEERREDYKIAVLGNSTTAEGEYQFKCWPRLLYEELGEEGITIYNGGIRGYMCSQELLKLIRDILPLKPDMIIVYDGYMEISTDIYHPFAFEYAKTAFSYMHKQMADDLSWVKGNDVCWGIEYHRNIFDNWLETIRTMYAIASERNIKFYAFCQPSLNSKLGRTVEEKNTLLSIPSAQLEKLMKESFRKYMEERRDIPDYIYDLSHIFDYQSDIYMDVAHVKEKGNRIIAKEIRNVIISESDIRNAI